jgi:hypothetical protein
MTARQENGEARLADGLGWFSIGLGLAEMASPSSVARLIGIPDEARTRTTLRAFGAREIVSGIGILSSNPHSGWLWARVAGDVLDLGALALARRRTDTDDMKVATAMASIAGVMVADIAAARVVAPDDGRPSGGKDHSRDVSKVFTINRPPEEVAQLWNELSLLDDVVDEVAFDAGPAARGTEVRITFRAGWFGRSSARTVEQKLRQFKQLIETGEIARSHGSSSVLQPARPLASTRQDSMGGGGGR